MAHENVSIIKLQLGDESVYEAMIHQHITCFLVELNEWDNQTLRLVIKHRLLIKTRLQNTPAFIIALAV